MQDISKISEYVGKITQKTLQGIVKANQETAQQVWEDVVAKAPMNTGDYLSSIQVGQTEVKDNKVTTEVFTDAQVKTKSGKSYNLGLLLETGTDPHAIPNAFGWGDKYGYDSDRYKRTLDPNWHPGTTSQAHFLPALNKNKQTYKDNIRKAIGGK